MTESANVELVRSIYAPWERGDFSSAEWADPEIEFGFISDGPAPAVVKGLSAMAQDMRDRVSVLTGVRFKAEAYRELDNNRVLVFSRVAGRGRASGLAIAEEAATVFHVRGGKVTRLVIYWDRDRALTELGLTP